MKRLCAWLLAALLLTLAACGQPADPAAGSQPPEPTPTPAQTQPFALAYDPDSSLHPLTGDSQVNLDLASLVYEGLYELDNSFTPRPVLAQSAQVDGSGLVWSFTLRPDAAFSDGTPLTADHVAASLRTAKSSALYGSRLSAVTAVRASDGVVTVTLSAPNGALPALLDIPVVLEQTDGAPLGSGRYRYGEGEEGLCLIANETGTLPYDTIPLRPVTSADQRIAAFDSGEVTAVSTDFSSAYALGYSGSYETCDYPTTTMLYVGFRTTGGPCRSALVRRACSMAFDRETVVRSQLSGHGDPASLPISPLHGEYSADLAHGLDYDRQGAAELLAQAGYTLREDGLLYQGRSLLRMTLIVNSDSGTKLAIADELAHSLSNLGVTVTVRKLVWEDYTAALAAGSFDLYIGEVRLTGDFDLTQLLAGSLNYGWYDSTAAAPLLSAWRAAQGQTRVSAAAALWERFAQDVPIAPLCFKRSSMLVRWGMVTNLQPTRSDLFHRMEEWQVVDDT